MAVYLVTFKKKLMNIKSRILTALAALLLLLLFVLPLWKISLMAPQYPDGLSMYLFINDIKDGNPGDIDNINIMNHYVGMHDIKAEDFLEFTYFPIVVVCLSIFGLIAALIGNRSVLLIWLIFFSVLGIMGIYDFYLWEYQYGHTLLDTAAIKVPGQAYQPPLFGRKEILNFIAYSYPQSGGYTMGISIFIGAIAWLISGKKK